MKIAEWKLIKRTYEWFRSLHHMVQKITIFILLVTFVATSFISVDDIPLFAWYIVFGFIAVILALLIWLLWALACKIYDDYL
jgi:uncharacterized membrane protein